MQSLARSLGVVYDPLYLEHIPPPVHPERPERVRSVVLHLKECGVWNQCVPIPPAAATEDELRAVHAQKHLDHVRSVCQQGGGQLDEGDTHASRRSFDVALLAAGGVLRAIDAVARKDVANAFCIVRPPGHHAEVDRPMGFCLFNNIAVGARYAQSRHGMKRVAVLDWDVHHGNGTQHIFEEDSSVFYMSLHQYPFYPGTGARSETGTGPGKGFTLNIPLPAGTGEAQYLRAFDDEIVPALKSFSPDLLMISAGFDAHRDDPLAQMELSDASYAAMTRRVITIAPIISVLEGGYDLHALPRSVEQHLRALGA